MWTTENQKIYLNKSWLCILPIVFHSEVCQGYELSSTLMLAINMHQLLITAVISFNQHECTFHFVEMDAFFCENIYSHPLLKLKFWQLVKMHKLDHIYCLQDVKDLIKMALYWKVQRKKKQHTSNTHQTKWLGFQLSPLNLEQKETISLKQ